MKITLAQLNYHIGNFDGNIDQMLAAITQAKSEGADIICFSELATCGYPPRDFLEFDDFIVRAEAGLEQLAAAATDIAVVVGTPTKNPVPAGKALYNSAVFLADGEVQYVQHKTLLPTYDVFDEYRYFEPADEWGIVTYKGKKIALTICEDIWDVPPANGSADFDPMYTVIPLDEMMKHKPDFIINLSASPYSYTHIASRKRILKDNCARYGLPMFYVNHVGAQTELIFDGSSLVMSPDGEVYDEMVRFETEIKTYDLDEVSRGEVAGGRPDEKIADMHDAIVLGVRDYFQKLGFTKAVLGLSGGIDSAVTMVIAARALGPENVTAMLMPSQFSSDHSVDDARQLAENLGSPYHIVPIKGVYDAYMEQLTPIFGDKPFDVTEENIQARVRGALNMAISNKYGNILLNTSNKSEMAVGYGTLYGDLCGGLSVLGDVYKMEVFAMARYMNKDGEVIPENTITKPPSAELRPDQKDSDSLPDYAILDEILELYIEQRTDPQDIIAMGHDEALVRRILRLVNINEFKRYQTAPVLRVSPKSFGMGRRMPIVGRYLS